jgi:hypothetical protein
LLADFPNFDFFESRPRPEQGGNPFFAKLFGSRFHCGAPVQPASKHRQRIAKAQTFIFNRPLSPDPLPLEFFQITEPKLGNRQARGLERTPNQLALNPYS